MAKQGTILVVDDNKAVLNALEMLLAGVFREVITLRTPNQIETRIRLRELWNPVRWMWCCWI